MLHALRRRLLAAGAILALLVLLTAPGAALATITGGCTATGTASGSPGADITTDPEWDLKSTDVVGGQGTAPALMTNATLYAYALGIRIPVVSGSGKGDTSGSVDSISLDTFSKLGKIFVVAGNATGPSGSCDGQILIVLDDVDALFTVLGGGGIVLAIIFLGAALATVRRSGCVTKVLGALLMGAGCACGVTAITQFNVISPTSPIGAAITVIGLVLGFLLAGSGAKPPNPPVATPPTTAPPPTTSPTPDIAPTADDVAKGAADLLGGQEPPPPDPNAPGVDVGPAGVDGGAAPG